MPSATAHYTEPIKAPAGRIDAGTGRCMHKTLTRPDESDGSPVGDEGTLIQAARDDPAAFVALYHRYRDRIYWYVRTRTPLEEDAADLTQQIFVQALDALAQYRPHRGPFAAW